MKFSRKCQMTPWHPCAFRNIGLSNLLPCGQNINKSAFVAYSGPCISKKKKLTKLIFNPIANIARTPQITFKHIYIFHMGKDDL